MSMTDLRDDKPMWGIGEVLALSWPAGLSMLNSTLMRFVDAILVAQLGPDTSGAQFIAGMTAFVPESLATGMLLVVNTYVSQNFGAGRHQRCGRYAWAGLYLALGFCCLIAPLALFARPLFACYGHPPHLQDMEVLYFRYMVVSIFFTLTSRPLEQFFYGIGRPRVVLAASLVANGLNLLGDIVLIFGKLGFPALGLEGAAIATTASWGVLVTIELLFFLSGSMNARYTTRRVRSARWSDCMDLIRIGWPAGVQFINDVLPWAVFTGKIVNIFGVQHFVASTVAMRWMPLSFMPAVGIGVASTTLVGRYVARGRPDLACRRAHAALIAAMVYMGLCGLAFWLLRYPMMKLFVTLPGVADLTAAQMQQYADEVIRIGGSVLICAAIFQLGDAIGIVYIGALRGAGDTLWPMTVTVILSWCLTIGGGYAMAGLLPSLGSIGPWIAASAYVIVLGVFVAWRFETGAWQKINLLGNGEQGLGRRD